MLWNTAPHQLNQDGCVIATTKNIEQHNIGLRNMVATLKAELVGATLTIFSLHDVFMSAVRNPSKFGAFFIFKTFLFFPFFPFFFPFFNIIARRTLTTNTIFIILGDWEPPKIIFETRVDLNI